MDTGVGTVRELWRFPVKSMAGESLAEAEVTPDGLLGDRVFAVIDAATGKVGSAKSVKLFPGMLDCRAHFVEPPRVHHDLPPVRITLPDGQSVTSDSPDVDRRLSAWFGNDVRLARTQPGELALQPSGGEAAAWASRDADVLARRIGSAFLEKIGIAPPVHVGAFLDLFPVTVLTTSTLECLAALSPRSRFDARRFRMNVIVATAGAGFIENEWIGCEVGIGDAVRLAVVMADPRCAMTTLRQEELPHDPEVLRTLVTHNNLELGKGGRQPCAGIYAAVGAAGTVRMGDRITVA